MLKINIIFIHSSFVIYILRKNMKNAFFFVIPYFCFISTIYTLSFPYTFKGKIMELSLDGNSKMGVHVTRNTLNYHLISKYDGINT